MLLAAGLWAACGDVGRGPDGADGSNRPGDGDAPPGSDGSSQGTVVVSVPPLAYLAEGLLGPGHRVVVMVPPGASPALYEPTVAQMRAVSRAAVYVAVGHPRFPFERAWLGQISAANPGMRVVRAGAECRRTEADPHLWMSPECMGRMVEATAGVLAGAGVADPDSVRRRREALLREVREVDERVSEVLEPHRGRSFLVFHPALGYLAGDYGLRQMAIQRGATETGAGDLARLIEEAREAGIRTVFVQPQFSTQAARLVARELPNGTVETVNPLARDWPGNLVAVARRLAASFGGAVEGTSDAGRPGAGTAETGG